MKIYTKAGDRGMTSLLGGELVPKDHPRLEAYGTLDELNSWTGLLRDHLEDRGMKKDLIRIQDRLMAGSSILASSDPEAIPARLRKRHSSKGILDRPTQTMSQQKGRAHLVYPLLIDAVEQPDQEAQHQSPETSPPTFGSVLRIQMRIISAHCNGYGVRLISASQQAS